jgi:site-specific DNA recombinase
MGWDAPEIVRDAGASAKNLRRPGVIALLDRVWRREIERMVIANLDRLTRSVRDLADLIDLCSKYDVALVSVGETLDTSSAVGRLVVNMLGVVAQWERERIAERVEHALAYKRQNQKVYGHTPFGYRREGDRLIPNPETLAALVRARTMHAQGASLRQIGAMLASSGLKPPRGGDKWHANSVREMLRSRMANEIEERQQIAELRMVVE